jgi:hypothetical protein
MLKVLAAIAITLAAHAHAAGLDFEKTLLEIHAPADATQVTAEFEFTNRTDKPVRITKYDAACTCMKVSVKDGRLTYAPGSSGVLRADFEVGNFSGTVDKVVALWLEGDPPERPSYALTVRVHIPVLVSLAPKTLQWETGGETSPQRIRITMQHTDPIHITGVTTSSPLFTTKLDTIEDGRVYELVVTPEEIPAPALAILRIETDCAIARHRIQQAFAVVRKPASAEPPPK